MKTVKIKGKEYVEVHQRILYLNSEEFEYDYDIQTEYQFYPDFKMWVVKATLNIYKEICESGSRRAFTFTGLAQEIIGDGYINKTSALENAETSAVGRACAMAGIGVIDSIASIDEINKAKAREDYNETPKKKHINDVEGAYEKARLSLAKGDVTVEQIKKKYDISGVDFRLEELL